ncbi:MAG TPA: Gfo/Idh/MocA family oxidoreductase, partial [Planctomycetaceae bacterium]|nr:Gfo/Idh/MocA family oxidoreductase [Planctomycetaceae bacterium]
MSKRVTRRDVLRRAAAIGVGVWVSESARRLQAAPAPNERLNIAAIGVGGRGAADVMGCASENIVALCDVDERRAGKTFERFPKAKKYRDFRKMLDEIGSRIDAVVVGTPDHTHAPAAAMAMRMGKHCYCEKPLTHNVYECRVLTELARKNKLATQLGTQIHAGDNYRRVVELIQAGAIGAVRQVEVRFPGGIGGHRRPKETPPVPKWLDWDLWLGPAPYRPYHPTYVPAGWRAWWDFANGTLGDFGCHYMDLPFWALKLKSPTAVEAQGPPPLPESTPPVLTVRYEFPARGHLPPVTMTWRHGPGNVPPIFKERKVPDWGACVLFVGEKGMLLANYGKHLLLPQSDFADYKRPEPTIPRSIGHHKEWIEACKTGKPTTCRFEYSGPLTEAVLLGNVSYRVQSRLEWDAENLKATNCPEADQFLR